MVKRATTLLLWKIGRGRLKLTFFMHHSAFSWKLLQKRENNCKIGSAVSLASVGTCSHAVVEAQALNASLVVSVGVFESCALKQVTASYWKEIREQDEEGEKGILKDGWRRSEQEGRKAAALSSGHCLVRILRGLVYERPSVCKMWWVRRR